MPEMITEPGSLDKKGHCERCGALLSAYALEELCPTCLLLGGLDFGLHASVDGPASLALNPELPANEAAGDRIGHYKLLQKIGEGGAGVVYMAEQEQPVSRFVALKVIKLGMDTRQVIARFEAERQALAMMDHPNIARVLDAGATDTGRPYFVMELVRGTRITDYCDQNRLPTPARLRLFIQICQAVQHAHQKGIIHRDLKPSNILVTSHDGVPVPKVIDFGIAKATTDVRLTDKTLFTAYEQFIGTPAYMSPEQAELSGLDIDTRSDIYSLGVLLYELLTGRTPFDPKELLASGLEAMRKTIREKEPLRPSTKLHTLQGEESTTTARCRGTEMAKLLSQLRGDLDWIVMKCLEKDRARRYETANGLARDLQRHLHNEPILARPPSTVYRVQKFIRRNRLFAAAATVVAATLVLGVCASLWETARAKRAERRAERLLYSARMRQAQGEWDQNHAGRVRQILEQTASYPERGFEWYYWQQQRHSAIRTLRGHLDEVWAVAFSPDGRRIVTGSKDTTVIVWDAISGTALMTLKGHLAGINTVVFSPDGQRIVTASHDGQAKVWDAATGQELFALRGYDGQIIWAAFSTDGRRIITLSKDTTSIVWDAVSGTALMTLKGNLAAIHAVDLSTNGQRIVAVDLSTNGQPIVTASHDGQAKVWDAATDQNVFAISPDRRQIVTPDHRTAKVWALASGERLLSLEHDGQVLGAAFSPDGRRIVTASADFIAKVWDAESGRELLTLRGHEDQVNSAAFSPDGRWIVTGSDDKTAKVWDAASEGNPLGLKGHDGEVIAAAFSPDGRLIATGSADQTAKVWEAATGKLLQTIRGHGGPIRSVAFSPDGQRLLTGSGDQTARVWEWSSSNPLFTLSGHDGPVTGVAYSPDGRWLATSSADHTRIWEAAGGRWFRTLIGHSGAVYAVAFSPDSGRIATAGGDGTAIIWETTSGRKILRLARHSAAVWGVAFSSDGKRIATAADLTAEVWEATRGAELVPLTGHSAWVYGVAFSPDGRRVVTCSWDRTAKVWDADSGEELLSLKGHGAQIHALAFSPDGQRIVTGSEDCITKVWRAATAGQVAFWQKEEKEAAQRLDIAAERERAKPRPRAP